MKTKEQEMSAETMRMQIEEVRHLARRMEREARALGDETFSIEDLLAEDTEASAEELRGLLDTAIEHFNDIEDAFTEAHYRLAVCLEELN